MGQIFQRVPAIAVVLNDSDVEKLTPQDIADADLIELRVDLFCNLEGLLDTFKVAKEKFSVPIISTIRIPEEGGIRPIFNRIELLRDVYLYLDFVDVEIYSDDCEEIVKFCKDRGIGLIGSYHNFRETPSLEELERTFERGLMLGVSVVKIATMVNSIDDLVSLIEFTIKHRQHNVVVIGMGDKGIPSRIITPVIGSKIIYASIRQKSAPGQLSLSDVVYILRCLGLR